MTDVSLQVEALATAWEQFKSVNDSRLKEIEKKGSADVLYTAQLDKISAVLDEQKSKMDAIEKAALRPDTAKSDQNEGALIKEHKDAFIAYARKGHDAGLAALETKALSVGSDPDGGYLVTPTMSTDITKIIFETSPMRQLASVETISTDSLDVIDDNGDFGSGWTGETTAVAETTSALIGKRNIPVHEVYAQPLATQKLLDDAFLNVEAWLTERISERLSRAENTAFISGNGSAQPRGILTYANGTSWGQIQQVVSGTSAVVTADGLIALFYSLKDGYSQNASFLMNRTVVQAVRTLKDNTNQYLWQPALSLGAPDALLGRPVFMATDMPVAAAASLSVACGDFSRAYKIVDRIGLRIMRDPYTQKPFVKFYATKRVGGDVTNFEAVKLLRLAVS